MKRGTWAVLATVALTIVPHAQATLVRGERISILIRASTFRLVSSVATDRGSAARIGRTETLCGNRGCLMLQLDGRSSGTWKVACGAGAYAHWYARGHFNGGSYEGLLVEAE
jgi:hypothetical protein